MNPEEPDIVTIDNIANREMGKLERLENEFSELESNLFRQLWYEKEKKKRELEVS